MSSTYGEKLKLTIFGQSHGAAIGMTMDGIPAGLTVDEDQLLKFMARRAPGGHAYATPRKEADHPEFLSGIVEGHTCGAPISAVIRNSNTRSGDYENLKDCPRPGHADYAAQIKYEGYQDVAGGGHFSGRLTAPICIAGGLCMQWLSKKGIRIGAHISSIHGIEDDMLDTLHPDLARIGKIFPTVNEAAGENMQKEIIKAKSMGDSVGGTITCYVVGLPAGLGDPMFGGVENRLAQILYGIPAVKGVEFGAGFKAASFYGSENNDPFQYNDGKISTITNHCGGILGGITNGMPLVFRIAVKPTPSISIPQQSISLKNQCAKTLEIKGRHDPCIVPRAVPVVEAAAAIALFDMIL